MKCNFHRLGCREKSADVDADALAVALMAEVAVVYFADGTQVNCVFVFEK